MFVYVKETNNKDYKKNVDKTITAENIKVRFKLKLKLKFKRLLNIPTIEKIDNNHYLYEVPRINNKKDLSKISSKTNNNQQIILSTDLKNRYHDLNYIMNSKDNVYLHFYLESIIHYILQFKQKNKDNLNIYLLINEYNRTNIEIIKNLLKNTITLTIVTNNKNSIKKFRLLEKNLYEDKGIIITITNNKTKPLKNAELVVNFDFKKEELESYIINRKCIIINCVDRLIDIKYFQGIIINDVRISFDNEKQMVKYKQLYDFIDEFDKQEVFNSFYIFKDSYKNNYCYNTIINNIKNNNLKITDLIGNNGFIDNKEFDFKTS